MCGIVIVLVAVAVGWLGCRYYDSQTDADSDNAAITVQHAQRDNQSTRTDIGDAATQIESAQSALVGGQADLDAAAERVNELQSRADADAAIITDCQKLLDVGRINLEEAGRIFADVDRENSGGVTPSYGGT